MFRETVTQQAFVLSASHVSALKLDTKEKEVNAWMPQAPLWENYMVETEK